MADALSVQVMRKVTPLGSRVGRAEAEGLAGTSLDGPGAGLPYG
ncbi:hypothetical protein [Streptomyces acidiscabies]